MVKKFLAYLHGWRGLALITYMWLILMAWVIVYVDVFSAVMRKRFYLVSISEVLLLILIYICPRLLQRAKITSINHDIDILTQGKKRNFFFKSWLASFGVLLIMYIIFYPGAFSYDSFEQFSQVIGIKNYNDWHPVIHTLFSFALPLKLSGGWLGSIVLFQIVLASLALSYTALTLAEYGSRKYAALFLAYILVNPATLGILMYPWKDVAFAVSGMMCMTFVARDYFSGGKFLNSPANIFLFIVFISSATLFRHNAVLFTFPLLLAVLFYAGKKQKAVIVTGCCVFVLAVKFILYPYLGVEKPGHRISETTRAPVTVMGNVLYEAPGKLDSDIYDFLCKIAPAEAWKESYVIGSFNSVKKTKRDIIDEIGYAKILGMTLRCLKEAPAASLRGFAALTDMVYGICGTADWGVLPGITSNDYGIKDGGINFLQRAFILYSNASRVLLKPLFWHVGVLILAIIIFILAKADLRKFFLSVPILAYDFGTMLFLGGNDFRFFCVTYLVFPLVILLLVREKCEAVS